MSPPIHLLCSWSFHAFFFFGRFLCIVTVGGSRGWTRMDGCTMLITLRKEQPGTDLSLCLQGTKTICFIRHPMKFQIFLHSMFKHKLFAIVIYKLVISQNTGSNYIYLKNNNSKKINTSCVVAVHLQRSHLTPPDCPVNKACFAPLSAGGSAGWTLWAGCITWTT